MRPRTRGRVASADATRHAKIRLHFLKIINVMKTNIKNIAMDASHHANMHLYFDYILKKSYNVLKSVKHYVLQTSPWTRQQITF